MFQAKNWSSFQSYKDRNPPWIRLHKRLLDDIHFQKMSADARAILPMLWLLISEDKEPVTGLLRIGYEEISFRLRQPEKVVRASIAEIIKAGFLDEIKQDKSICYETVTEPLQNCYSETEAKTKTYKEETDIDVIPAVEIYNDFARENGLSLVQKLTAQRKSKLKARLSDCGGVEGWRIAIGKIAESDFLMGRKTDWKASFDFLLAERSFTKLMEDGYKTINADQKNGRQNGNNIKQQTYELLDSLRERDLG